MRIPFLLTVILAVSLSGCNMPGATAAPIPAGIEGPAAGMPAYFTNASAPAEPAVPSGPQVGSKMLWVDNSILVFVPGGEFIRGTGGGEDNPTYTVDVSPFWIYRAEVTNTQYALCISVGECSALEDADAAAKLSDPVLRDHPVVGVTYSQSEAYCKWITGELPTEAQWEKSARGPQANIYPWGDEAPTCDLTNFSNCNIETTDIRGHLTGKSYYEALDLAGNVFEWALDWYAGDYYKTAPPADPPGPSSGTQRVVRGGGYQTVEADLLSARRFSLDPLKTRPDLGFRCVVNDPGNFAPYCQASPLLTGNSFPGQPGGADSGSTCEPPNVYVGGSYCTNNRAYVNVFTEGEATIVGDQLSCAPAADGLVTCSGPNFYSGEVQVCGTCAAPAVPQEPAQGEAEIPPGPDNGCPNPGYDYDEAAQACVWSDDDLGRPTVVDDQVYCPVGSEPDPTGSVCTAPPVPANGQGECPSWGYAYNPESQMCLWRVRGSGPSGICLDPQTGFAVDHSRCAPDGDIGAFTYQCPLGMELDATGAFCVQAGGGGGDVAAECANGVCDAAAVNDFACPVGTYLDEGVDVCVPASDNPSAPGCIAGFNFNAELGCCQVTTNTSSAACPAGELLDPMLGCINPPSINNSPESSCITATVDLPNCERRTGGDTPGGGNNCSSHNGSYSACTAAGCSYDTLTNTCN